MPEVRQAGYIDMPDYVTKKGWALFEECLCFFTILSLVTPLVSVAGALVGVYAFLTAFDGGRILEVPRRPCLVMIQLLRPCLVLIQLF